MKWWQISEAFNRPTSRNVRLALSILFITLATIVIMTVFQVAKTVLDPDITLQQSHFFTIIFAGLVAPVVSFFVLLKFEGLYQKAFRENEERKRAEEHLYLTQNAIDHFGDIAIWIDMDGHITYVNEATCKMLGYARDELLAMGIWDIERNATPDSIRREIENVKQAGSLVFQTESRARDGRHIPVEVSARYYNHGDQEYLITFARDITERKRAEQALEFERLQLLSIFDSIDEVIYVADPYTYEVLYANRAMQDKFGKSLIGGICYREIQNRDAPCEFCTNDIILRNKGEPYRWEFHNPTVNLDFGIVDRIIKWPDGRDVRFELAVDITDRKRAENALRASEEMLRGIIDSSPIPMVLYNEGERYYYYNKKFTETFGYTIEDIPTINEWWKLAYPDEKYREFVTKRWYAASNDAMVNKASIVSQDVEITCKDGSKRHVLAEFSSIGSMNLAVLYDITERKRAEDALKRSRANLARSQEMVLLHNWALNFGTGEMEVSDQAYRTYGYEVGGVKPTASVYLSHIHPDDRKKAEHYLEMARSGNAESVEYRIIRRDGAERIMNSIIDGFIRNDEGKVVWAYGIGQDITERKRAEKELAEAKAQAELYLDLMGHDINNLHQVALGYLEMARDMPPGTDQSTFLEKPVEVLQRSAQLISNVRKLQKLQDGVFQTQDIDVSRVLSDVRREFGAVPNKQVTLNVNGHGSCHVRANELLHDVFANLVSNAIKHTGDGKEVVVNLDMVHDDGGRFCRVTIEDDGPGIPDASKERIFNRMHKGTARGMGLGLYLVKTLVNSYDGKVWAEDRLQGDHTKGARFVVLLPAVEK